MKTIKNARLTRIFVLALVLCMACSLMLPATALAANTAVNEAKNGVVQVRLDYIDDNGEIWFVSAGTGFLINDNTVLTCNHVITQTLEDMEEDAATVGKTVPEFQSRLKIKVTVSRDVTIDATVINSSDAMDFAILRLSTNLQGKTPLPLRSSATVEQTEQVFAIGFPDISIISQSFNTFTSADATITEGVVNKNGPYGGGNIDYLQTSCNLDYGNSGGPMVDENGNVIGLCNSFIGDDATTYFYAVAIDQVIEVLTALGIPFPSATDVPAQPVETQPVETQPVETQPVETNPPATLPPVVIPTEPVNVDEPDGNNMTMILIIAAIAVAVIVVVVVVIVAGGKKKQAAPAPVAPVPPVAPNSFAPAPTTPIQGAGETTVLNAGAGETTVLSHNVNGGTLIRKRTGETVSVNAETFIIGRERNSVNFCIADNSAVSRVHAKLMVRGGVVYLTSMTEKNGTFHNNTKIQMGQEVALKNGDRITLANEELEYRN